jgi:tetratricopeptide (TPR) repeat protein
MLLLTVFLLCFGLPVISFGADPAGTTPVVELPAWGQGDWDAVIRLELPRADAALDLPAGERGEFVSEKFPVAIEHLVYAYLQKGEDDAALAQMQRLQSTARLAPTPETAFHLASTQARYLLERRDWSAALQVVAREPAATEQDRFWPAEAITRFVRGLGAAHLGKLDEARAERAHLQRLEDAARKVGAESDARDIQALGLELSAWRAHMEGKVESSVGLMIEASELGSSVPKNAAPPGAILPANELLGDMLLEQDQAPAALVAFQRSLERYPRRFNSLLGAARAARTVGDEALARKFYEQLLELANGGQRKPAMLEAKSYLAKPR